jgi:hypothetical protein
MSLAYSGPSSPMAVDSTDDEDATAPSTGELMSCAVGLKTHTSSRFTAEPGSMPTRRRAGLCDSAEGVPVAVAEGVTLGDAELDGVLEGEAVPLDVAVLVRPTESDAEGEPVRDGVSVAVLVPVVVALEVGVNELRGRDGMRGGEARDKSSDSWLHATAHL